MPADIENRNPVCLMIIIQHPVNHRRWCANGIVHRRDLTSGDASTTLQEVVGFEVISRQFGPDFVGNSQDEYCPPLPRRLQYGSSGKRRIALKTGTGTSIGHDQTGPMISLVVVFLGQQEEN